MVSKDIAANFQRIASVQGAQFHAECILALRLAGFEIADQGFTINEIGIEIDAITNNANGIAMPWEFKGSWQGVRPGLMRTDTAKKAIANGYLLSRWTSCGLMTPLLIMTTHQPYAGSAAAMLSTVERSVILGVVDSRDSRRLQWLYRATETQLRNFINGE